MDIKKEFQIQYEKDFIVFSEQKKDKTKEELIFTEMGIPTDNKKLVKNCLIYSYLYILYMIIFIVMLPLVMIYSASIEEGLIIFSIMFLILGFSMFIIKPLHSIPFILLTRNKILEIMFREQVASDDLVNILKSSLSDELKEPVIYNLMNTGYLNGTNARLKEYLFSRRSDDIEFQNKIEAINGNIKERIEELTNAQKSWEEKKALDTVCRENIVEDNSPNLKRKRL